MKVVSNTTPLIGLASIDRLDLLPKIFGEIQIPQAVWDELIVKDNKQDKKHLEMFTKHWIHITSVQNNLARDVLLDELDLGEAETIVLAQEIGADWILMDEKKGRRKLNQFGMPKIGTVGILLRAKQVGLITDLRNELFHLRNRGFSISQYVVDSVVEEAGEL